MLCKRAWTKQHNIHTRTYKELPKHRGSGERFALLSIIAHTISNNLMIVSANSHQMISTRYALSSLLFQQSYCACRNASSSQYLCIGRKGARNLSSSWASEKVWKTFYTPTSTTAITRNLSRRSTMESAEAKKLVTVACVQLCCTEDKSKNFETARDFILQAKERNAKMVFLPEAFDFMGRTKDESSQLSENIDGHIITSYRNLAKELGIWLSLGGFHERQVEMRESNLPWMSNNHILIDSSGEIKSMYRKVHLFDVVIPEEKINLKESSFIRAGTEIVKPVETPIGNLGLGICYDVRFPEFSLALRKMGADILTYPSAFTVPTGQAHWETLMRARAIETQCFVISAAQSGRHNEKRTSYGHSVIIDPWGKVLADAQESVGIITAEIDLNQTQAVRKKLPVMDHRQETLYLHDMNGAFTVPNSDTEFGSTEFQFGHLKLKYNTVFLESKHARAFVNKKCVAPGHVLVSSKRIVRRVCELSVAELSDIFSLVQKVQVVIESLHGATSSTITVQDGKDSGQTIEHVHVHVLPRKPDDFKENDEIYEKLRTHDKGENVQWREESEMLAECNQIREHIKNNLAHLIV